MQEFPIVCSEVFNVFDPIHFATYSVYFDIQDVLSYGPFTNTYKGGGLMQKKFIAKFFGAPLSDRKKNSAPPPICHENYGSIP